MKNKLIKMLIFTLSVVLIVTVILTVIKSKKQDVEQTQVTYINQNDTLKSKQLVIKSINEINKIEVSQIKFTKEIEITKGKTFKKTQSITFSGIIHNTLDLKGSVIKVSDNVVKVYTKAIEQSVEFLEGDTSYSEVEKDFLAFGDIELLPREYESLKSNIREQVLSESQVEISNIKYQAEISIENTLNKLTNENYTVVLKLVN